MASPTASPVTRARSLTGEGTDISALEVPQGSVTAKLAGQTKERLPYRSVKGMQMEAIAEKALQVIMDDKSIPTDLRQRRAVKVVLLLLSQESINYPESAIQSSVGQAATKIANAATSSACGKCVIM
jgi:hypothetical protein